MSAALPYPRLVVADIHVHERHGRFRMREVDALLTLLEKERVERGIKTLIIAGDLFDRNTPPSIVTVLSLGMALKKFPHPVIIAGNHDTPVRTKNITMLDIFKMAGVTVVAQTTEFGPDLFLPYFDALPTVNKQYASIYMHKDIFDTNGYCDPEFGIGFSDIPECKNCFNGHLHAASCTALPNGGTFIQCGAPYPTSWSDTSAGNNFIWLEERPGQYAYIPTNITGDALDTGMDNPGYLFTRHRRESASDYDEAAIMFDGLQALRDDHMTVDDVMALTSIDDKHRKIIREAVLYASNKLDAIRI